AGGGGGQGEKPPSQPVALRSRVAGDQAGFGEGLEGPRHLRLSRPTRRAICTTPIPSPLMDSGEPSPDKIAIARVRLVGLPSATIRSWALVAEIASLVAVYAPQATPSAAQSTPVAVYASLVALTCGDSARRPAGPSASVTWCGLAVWIRT